jgi:hypothetical protein
MTYNLEFKIGSMAFDMQRLNRKRARRWCRNRLLKQRDYELSIL